jgi:hypothetical protein
VDGEDWNLPSGNAGVCAGEEVGTKCCRLGQLPLYEGGVGMVFEARLDRDVERRILQRVAEQITDHDF